MNIISLLQSKLSFVGMDFRSVAGQSWPFRDSLFAGQGGRQPRSGISIKLRLAGKIIGRFYRNETSQVAPLNEQVEAVNKASLTMREARAKTLAERRIRV